MSTVLQGIIIPKHYMSKRRAIDWVKKHYEYKKIDETPNTWRFRQQDPRLLATRGFHSYYTYTLPNGVRLVFVKRG
jgi:putative SOS response-associated peptidase YedK